MKVGFSIGGATKVQMKNGLHKNDQKDQEIMKKQKPVLAESQNFKPLPVKVGIEIVSKPNIVFISILQQSERITWRIWKSKKIGIW